MGVEEAVPPNRKGKVLPRNRTQSANFTKEMTFFSKEEKAGEAKEAEQDPPHQGCLHNMLNCE